MDRSTFDDVCSPKRLYSAWSYLRPSVRNSGWKHILTECNAIEADPLNFILNTSEALKNGIFSFDAKLGYTKRKSGGSRRGIVVASISDRIVQRSILTALTHPSDETRSNTADLRSAVFTPNSMAGAPGKSTGEAVHLVHRTMRDGATHFVCTDVKSFYPYIPRDKISGMLRNYIADERFCDLFMQAITTELSNKGEMEPWIDLFPVSERGVPQGSPLSVLSANLVLSGLDAALNTSDLTTVRYLDDFIILGKSRNSVDEAFSAALAILRSDGMDAYLPRDGSQKAWSGRVENGVDFLGCRVNAQNVSPSRRAKRTLLEAVKNEISEAKRAIAEVKSGNLSSTKFPRDRSVSSTLLRTSNMSEGWANAFSFCSNRLPFHQLQRRIDVLQRDFVGWSVRYSSKLTAEQWKSVWGGASIANVEPRSPRVPFDS